MSWRCAGATLCARAGSVEAGRRDVGEEQPRRVLPAVFGRLGAHALAIERQCGERRLHADRPTAPPSRLRRHHVLRPAHGKRRDRHARRHGLEQHHAEGVGAAREHEHVGRGVAFGERLAGLLAGEQHVGIARRQLLELRAAADHHLAAGQIEIEERVDVLLGRDASDVEEHRASPNMAHGARAEQRRCRRRASTAARARSLALRARAPSDGVATIRPRAGIVEAAQDGRRPRRREWRSAGPDTRESACGSSS